MDLYDISGEEAIELDDVLDLERGMEDSKTLCNELSICIFLEIHI